MTCNLVIATEKYGSRATSLQAQVAYLHAKRPSQLGGLRTGWALIPKPDKEQGVQQGGAQGGARGTDSCPAELSVNLKLLVSESFWGPQVLQALRLLLFI